MKLIIDANIILSALIAPNKKTKELIFLDNIQLFAPDFLRDEFDKHKNIICEKSSLNINDLNLLSQIIFSRIHFISFYKFQKNIKRAIQICPDPNDTEYFALALTLKYPIWSNDKKLKEQNFIKIINTSELIKILQHI